MSVPPSERRRSSIDLLRRISVDLAVQVGALDLEELQRSAQVAADIEEGNDGTATNSESNALEVTHNPVTLFNHTIRSNFDGIVSALPAAGMIILAYRFVGYVASRGGVWGDRHAALCALCMVMTEIIFCFGNSFEGGYMRKRRLFSLLAW